MKIESDLFSLIAEKTDLIVVLYREKFLYANPSALRLLGYTPEEAKSLHVWDVVHPSYRERVKEMVLRRLSGKEEVSRYAELPVRSKDGSYRVVQLNAFTVKLGDGYAGMAIGMDKSREKELNFVLANAWEVVSIVDEGGVVRYKSPSARRILGWSEEELMNRPFTEILHPEDRNAFIGILREMFRNPGRTYITDYRVRTKLGDYRWMRANLFLPENWQEVGLEGVVVNERDITEKKLLEDTLTQLTLYDPLTGLPNRLFFLEELKYMIELAKRRKELLPVIVVDIFSFKEINVAFGISAGDRVLKEVAQRLKKAVRNEDTVSRFFSDRFGISVRGIHRMENLTRVLEKVRGVFAQPFSVNSSKALLSANIGVSLYPHDSDDPEELVKRAEGALLKAREMGPGAIAFFSEEVDKEVSNKLNLLVSLREALKKDLIVPYYQPVHDLQNLELIGVEVLARWEAQEGNIPPSQFIPIAESSGLILELGRVLLEKALRDIASSC